MNKTMKVLFLYRLICHLYPRLGRAVSIQEIKREVNYSHGSLYNYINELIYGGFIIRVAEGFYTPFNVYQWHMDDFLNKENGDCDA